MLKSEERILTTHAGSLPRPAELTGLLVRVSRREAVDTEALRRAVESATEGAVRLQIEAGIDVGNDGEQARESFFTYVQHRMSGFSGRSDRPVMRDIVRYPTFLQLRLPDFSRTMVDLLHAPAATGDVRYADRKPLEDECAGYRRALARQAQPFAESFMTAASPGIVATAMVNRHYAGLEDYVSAVASALRTEYEYIVGQGFVLQIDCPDLAMERHTSFADRPVAEFLKFVDLVVDRINDALAAVPAERVRMHVCWGNYEGPHEDDVPLEEILPRLYRAGVGALMLSMANPRHAHEYRCFERYPLPPDKLLIVGAVDTTTNYVEHPEVVADRIERAARAVGDPHRVLAGTDCGFDTAAGLGEVATEIVWRKLRALSDGAAIASARLLGQ